MRLFGVIFLLLARVASAQIFEDLHSRIEAALPAHREAIVDSFLRSIPSFPLVEDDSVCVFLWRGSASSVALASDENLWDPSRGSMRRLSTTDLWWRAETFPSDARIDYKYVINGAVWVLDPLNHNRIEEGFGENSELRMPDWVFPCEISRESGVPHGTLWETSFFSQTLGNARTLSVYVPACYFDSSDSLPLLLVHDGVDYLAFAHAANVLDNLIARQALRPLIAVFVPPVDRRAEYAGARIELFTRFIVSELLPFLQSRYRISRRAEDRASLGASNGGNIALWLAYAHPEEFGGAGLQSSNVLDTLCRGFQHGPKLTVRLSLEIGTFDIPVLMDRMRRLCAALQARGYSFRYREIHEGHSWGNWRGHLAEVLMYLFPPEGRN